jgi:hypothetical protein
MLLLAVSGPVVLGTAIVAAVVLLAILLRLDW